MSAETERETSPSAFDLGRMAGHVETMGRELREVKDSLITKVSHAEFQRAVRVVLTVNLLILTSIVGLAFMALRAPTPR